MNPVPGELSRLPDLPEFARAASARAARTQHGGAVTAGCLDRVGRLSDPTDWVRSVSHWFGGTPPEGAQAPAREPLDRLARRLNASGIPVRQTAEDSLEDLALAVERRAVVLATVNAGVLLGAPDAVGAGGINALVAFVGVTRDAATEQITAFHIIGTSDGAPRRVSAADVLAGWLDAGGVLVVTYRSLPPV